MKSTIPTFAAVAALLCGGLASSQAAVPPILNYQGRIASNGTNFNGMGQFKFVLLEGRGSPAYWNNSGSATGTNQPATAVSVPVVNGLYSVLLGDTNLPSMTAIPVSVFNNADVRLRVWFNNGVNGFQLLTPDQRVVAAGYAVMAAGVQDGAVTSAKLANGAVTASKLASNAITSVALPPAVVTATHLGPDVPEAFKHWNDLHLGGCTNCASFHVSGTDLCTPAVTIDGCISQISAFLQANSAKGVEITARPYGGEIILRNAESNLTVIAASSASAGGYLELFNGGVRNTVYLDGHDLNGGGRVSIQNTNGGMRAEIKGEGLNRGGEFNVADANGTITAQLLGAGASTGQGAALTLRQGNGTRTVLLDAEDGDNGGGRIKLFDHNGNVTIDLNADLGGAGTSKITTDVLHINGADFSERFDIDPRKTELKPGMIVSIDPEHPGRLQTSIKSYDTTVAGIVSGAGGVRVGLLMGHQGTLADGQYPVALSGRVYCLVDADRGAIRPGDLITTSDTPGHGMKVADSAQAQGAIIGKAMTGLSEGKGMVLVLVTLQ